MQGGKGRTEVEPKVRSRTSKTGLWTTFPVSCTTALLEFKPHAASQSVFLRLDDDEQSCPRHNHHAPHENKKDQ